MNHKEGQELATGTNEHDWMSREQNWKLSDPRECHLIPEVWG